jgi:serine/threonine protein kinase
VAFLTDFGLSNVTAGAFGSYITSYIGGSVRWAPPEQFRLSRDYRISTLTTHGDIYSYGSVILQVRTTMVDKDTHALANHLSHIPDVVRKSALSSPEKRRRGLA